jgi:small-conductance mechanosensitive channel
VLDHPVAAAFLVSLLSLWIVGARAPLSYYDAVFFFAPLPACRLCIAASGNRVRWTCWALVVALALAPFRSLLELWPLGERVCNEIELLLVLGALVVDFRKKERDGSGTSRWLDALGALCGLLLTAALLQNTFGQIGWARTLRSGVLGSLGLGMIYVSAFHALFGMGLVVLRTRLAGYSRLVRDWRREVEIWLFRALCFWAVFGMIVGPIFAFGLDDYIPKILDRTMAAQLHVGEVTLSGGSLIMAALSLCGAWLMMGIVGALLEHEILPRFGFGQGVPYAIAALARYAVGLAGLLFAMAAAGLDLSKITLLAGAVGVGVGFGLQNIVNNFVSGLILLIERPFHVGDMVETPSANGIVRRIGIRASTIRTSQGADVIVPNGDLLSKALLNWTLSNRFRRIELEIGVAYGSDPETVERLLVEAALGNSAVRAEPAPQALFVNFGDSALVFRLQAWVEDAGSALSASSQLRATILAKLSAAGIEMPFPQREVWLHEVKDAAER